MRHMEIAFAQVGVTETPGRAATDDILQYFRDVGRSDIISDEVAWCAAALFAILSRAGISIAAIPHKDRLLARSALLIGTPIAEPRYGCVAVLPRNGSSWQAHTGIVTAVTKTRVKILGGNQSNAFNEQWFSREGELGYRWVVPAATPKQLAQAGSKTVAASKRQQKDAGKATAIQVSDAVVPEVPPSPTPSDALPNAGDVLQQGSQIKGWLETGESLAVFLLAKWPWVAGALALYWLARIAWDSAIVRKWRTHDHNTGANTALAVEPEPVAPDEVPA